MKFRIILIAVLVGTIGLAAIAGQKTPKATPSPRQAVISPDPRIEIRLAEIQRWLDSLPSGMSEKTKAKLLTNHRERFYAYRGTEISPNLDAVGDTLLLHQRLSGQFKAADITPPQRLAHFQWILRPDLVHTGWYGIIQKTAKIPGGHRMRIAVSPRIESLRGGVAFTPDQYIEEYEYSGGQLTFVSGEDPPRDLRGSIMID